MKYYRPETIEEALGLLSEGVPLAGGTTLVPGRRTLDAVIDLGELGLDQIQVDADRVQLGAATRLQRLLDPGLELPHMLKRACRLEAAWNLRNMATVGGTIMAADARSPLLLLLLVLGANLSISDGEAEITLDELLDRRNSVKDPFLIRQITFNQPNALHYEYVARTPADRPIVSAAASAPDRGEALSVAIGGYGERPLCLDPVQKGAIEDAQAQAAQSYSTAADAFASAEYRSEIVSILVGRTLKEVQG